MDPMDPMDPMDQLPPESRAEVVQAVRDALGVDVPTAEQLVRAAEPLWDALEDAGGLVDGWGGGEFSWRFPAVLAFIRSQSES